MEDQSYLLEAFPGPSGVLSVNGTVLLANRELSAMGIRQGGNVLDLVSSRFLQTYTDIINELFLLKQHDPMPKLYKEVSGDGYFYVAYISMMDDKIIFFARDEMKFRQSVQSLMQDASIDPLTGLLNRRQFLKEVDRYEIPKGQVPFVIYFDIDHFKKVNDTYGHDAGDDILRFVARTARTALRVNDILARAGGEEFMVFGSCKEKNDVWMVAERMRTIIADHPATARMQGEDVSVPVHISLGIDYGIRKIDELITNADTALYHSKENGRNRTTVYAAGLRKKDDTPCQQKASPRNA